MEAPAMIWWMPTGVPALTELEVLTVKKMSMIALKEPVIMEEPVWTKSGAMSANALLDLWVLDVKEMSMSACLTLANIMVHKSAFSL